MISINPATEECLAKYPYDSEQKTEEKIESLYQALPSFQHAPCLDAILRLKKKLLAKKNEFASLISEEMGKHKEEAISEIEKCAKACSYVVQHAESFLKEETIDKATICFEPLGVILAIMPWNFPFWQVFRFAPFALAAGNGILLKAAPNVCGSSFALQELFEEFPFQSLFIKEEEVARIIHDRRVHAITLTGSTSAGSAVAKEAGSAIKKCVLELGGSDPFIVYEDADLKKAVKTAIHSRLLNSGQSCIAAKRFFIQKPLFQPFLSLLLKELKNAPKIAPLARDDLRHTLHSQIKESSGEIVLGGKMPYGKGFYYPITVMTDLLNEARVLTEETFGPLFPLVSFETEKETIFKANQSSYALGGTIFTEDLKKAARTARCLQAGSVSINGMTASDPSLPFGGCKKSGYGRELSGFGLRAFINIKAIC